MTLNQWIDELGAAKVAGLLDIKERTVHGWRRKEREPRPEVARQIVALTDGEVSFEGIYARENAAA